MNFVLSYVGLTSDVAQADGLLMMRTVIWWLVGPGVAGRKEGGSQA